MLITGTEIRGPRVQQATCTSMVRLLDAGELGYWRTEPRRPITLSCWKPRHLDVITDCEVAGRETRIISYINFVIFKIRYRIHSAESEPSQVLPLDGHTSC